jgi:citrate synthase
MPDTQKPGIPETANKGLEGIVACTSEISTIADVTLLYRGYTIEDLAANCGFEEVTYLLWQGELPTSAQLESFKQTLYKNMTIPAELLPVIESVAKTTAHSMAKLRTVVSYYSQLDAKAEDITIDGVREKATRMAAVLGPIVSALSRCEQGQKPIAPNTSKSLAWNFLNMVRGKEPTAEEEKLFDTALVLHADHELNASTFACRAIASTNSDYYSAIVAGLASLKGPLHGGANEAVMIMLKEIGSYANIDQFIDDAVNAKKKVMGIGHRVYKHGDPRAKLLKELSLKTCQKAGLEEYHRMLVHIQEQMEEKKGLMPNVDFYSGLVYTALGLRSRDFTPIFAVSRITGWSAQLLEQYANNRIYRPRAFYTGKIDRKVTPIASRK